MDPSTRTWSYHDPVFYFRNVVVKVGDTIFRVPRDGFEVPGTVFETMFTLPGNSGCDCEGSSDDNPIVLPVNKDHFRGFLGAMYPFSGRGMTKDGWIGALDLATMWTFKEIRKRAIDALDTWVTRTQEPREAALLAKKYEVLSWLKTSYSRLLQRNPLTLEELTSIPALDWETIARLFFIKQQNQQTPAEYLMSHPSYIYYRCSQAAGPRAQLQVDHQDRYHDALDDVFKTEFESMDATQTSLSPR